MVSLSSIITDLAKVTWRGSTRVTVEEFPAWIEHWILEADAYADKHGSETARLLAEQNREILRRSKAMKHEKRT